MVNLSLLGIPTELRLRIYRNCMVIGVADTPTRRYNLHFGEQHFEKANCDAQVLRVCKTLYEEGVSVLYGENILTSSMSGA